MRYFLLIFFLILNACTYEITDAPEPEETQTMQIRRSATGSITPGARGQGIQMQCPFDEQGNYTVQFKVRDPNTASNLAPGDVVRMKAKITWTVSGNPISRIVDVGDGVSVTGTAEVVNVSVYDDSFINGGTISRPVEITIVAAKGVRAPIQQPPFYSLPRDSVAPGASVLFDIPQEAGVVSVNIAVAPATIGGTIGAYQILAQHFAQSTPLKIYDPRQSDWVPIMPGTTQIRILADPALISTVNLQVTFGIDG